MRVMLYTANCKGNKKNCIYPIDYFCFAVSLCLFGFR